jgi:hypothetical protein
MVNDDRRGKSGLGEPASYRFEAPSAVRAARTAAGELWLAASASRSWDEQSWVKSSRR